MNNFPLPGGSNLLSCRVDDLTPTGSMIPHGYVAEFHLYRDRIESQLTQMYASGQRRLRIPILARTDLGDSIWCQVAVPRLVPQAWQNLEDLIAAIKAAGFAEIELAFFPGPGIDPHDWTSWNEGQYQLLWNLVAYTRAEIGNAAGIPVRYDLLNEGIEDPSTLLFQCAHRLWLDYGSTGQHPDASISFVPRPTSISWAAQCFGADLPTVLLAHIYGAGKDPYPGWGSAYDVFCALDAQMRAVPWGMPLAVTECFPDAIEMAELQRASQDTGRPIRHITAWPIGLDWQLPETGGEQDRLVLDYSALRAIGF